MRLYEKSTLQRAIQISITWVHIPDALRQEFEILAPKQPRMIPMLSENAVLGYSPRK